MKLNTVKPLNREDSPHKFCIYSRGGLGDAIRRYFDVGDGWEYLTSLKTKYPNSIVKYIALNANSQTAHFFKYHPHLDCVIQGKWAHPHIKCDIINELKGDGYQLLEPSVTKDLILQKQHQIHLNEEDHELISKVKSKGPYILLHPFAGEETRRIMPIKEYFPLIELFASLDLNTVVVGANWKRGNTNIPAHEISEAFPFEHNRLINLIDKASPRTVAGLVLESKCLVSVRSFCFAITKSERIKSVVLVSSPKTKNCHYLTVNQTMTNLLDWGWSEDNINKNIRVVGGDHNFSDTRKEIMQNLKGLL